MNLSASAAMSLRNPCLGMFGIVSTGWHYVVVPQRGNPQCIFYFLLKERYKSKILENFIPVKSPEKSEPGHGSRR